MTTSESEYEDDLLEEEIRRIQEALEDVQRKKRERLAVVMRENSFQGRSTDAYEDSYFSEDESESESEPGSANTLAKGMIAVQERARFNLQKLEEKYLEKENNKKDSDLIEFDTHGNVYFPSNMSANQQQIQLDKMFRDDMRFGKGAISAPCNSEEVFRGDSRAWRESKKRDKMYQEFRRNQRRSFARSIHENEENVHSRKKDRPRDEKPHQRRRMKYEKKEEEEDVDSEEDLSDEVFSDGNTSDDLSSEVFTSSGGEEEEGDDDDVKEENDKKLDHPTSSNSNHLEENQREKSERKISIKKEKTTPEPSKKQISRKRAPIEESETPKEKKTPEVVPKKTPKIEPEKEPRLESSQVKERRVSPRNIKKENVESPSVGKSIEVEVPRTPITRNSSKKMKMEVEQKVEIEPKQCSPTKNEPIQLPTAPIEVTPKNEENVDVPTTSRQSDQQDVIVIEPVERTTSIRRRSQRNKKRTLDEHWNTPSNKKPKVDSDTESITSIEVNFDESDITDEKPSRRKSNRKVKNNRKPVEGKIWDQEIDFSEFGSNKLFGLATDYHSKLKITFFDFWNSTSRLVKLDTSDKFDVDFRRYMSTHKKQRHDFKAGYDIR